MNPFPPEPIPYADVSASWMRRLMSACRMCLPIAGPGLRAKYTPNGVILSAAAGRSAPASSGTAPFAVRWHQPENADGQWEIYMPAGCVSLGGACGVLNAPASDTDGHANEAGWYLLPFGGSPSDGDAYRVIVHCKRRAIAADDLPESGEPEVSPMILAWMHDSDEAAGQNIAYAGDEQSFQAAAVRYSSAGSGAVAPIVTQSATGSVHYTGTQNAEFDLWWAFSIDGTTLSVPEMGLLRRTLSTGTDVATIEDPVACEGAIKGIYLRVALNGSVELSVALDVNSTAAGANFFIVQLYGIDQYHVANDFRSALWRLPMYLVGDLGGGS